METNLLIFKSSKQELKFFFRKFDWYFFPKPIFNLKQKALSKELNLIARYLSNILVKQQDILKKFIYLRILHINEDDFCYLMYRHTSSNIYFTLVSFWGQILYTCSGGQSSFAKKQTKRGKTTPDAVIHLIRKLCKNIRLKNYKKIIIVLRNQPRPFTWSFLCSELDLLEIMVIKYLFIIPLAHNGCRKKKPVRK